MATSTIANRVQILNQKFTDSLGLPFQNLLPESMIQEALNAEKITYRKRLFDTAVRSTGGTPARGCLPFVSEASGVAQITRIFA